MVYAAIDIGASSGKIVKGFIEEGKLKTEVTYRFANSLKEENGHLVWPIEELYGNILKGLRETGYVDYISLDTWAVDYVLLGKNGERLSQAISYRDKRTDNVKCPISKEELYGRTGIQYQKFNTLYQLLAEDRKAIDKAEELLMIPDYLAFLLTGEKVQEYTNATTTNLLKAGKAEWDFDLIKSLNLPHRLFKEISMPGKILGKLRKEVEDYIGYSTTFILAPTHDTASAVLATPLEDNSLFLSSGTWSLLGTVIDSANVGLEAMMANLTNEGTDNGKIRLLKNIMGTWMLQNVRKEFGNPPFDEIIKEAKNADLIGLVDPLSDRFLSPRSMSEEIKLALEEKGLREPKTLGEIALVIYESLANAYKEAANEIERICKKKINHIAIVGGGAKDEFLNELTAKRSNRLVTAGPIEASATGSLLSAMIHTNAIKREDIPNILKRSFSIKSYGGGNDVL